MGGFEEIYRRSSFDSRLPFITPLGDIEHGRTAELRAESAGRIEDAASTWAAGMGWQDPPGTAVAAQLLNHGRRTTIDDLNNGTGATGERVGVPMAVVVSCSLCEARLEVACLGYGDMVRRVEEAGWHIKLGQEEFYDSAWCSKCCHRAGEATR